MNTYCTSGRRGARIAREHFMLYHFAFFAECRTWTTRDMVTRLKAEGLLSKSTHHADCRDVNRFWRNLTSQ